MKCNASLQAFPVVSFLAMALLPAASMADMNYTFIKMTCDPQARTVSIKAFYDWNDEGRARVKRHEKDTYYLNEVSGKTVKCDLGNKRQVSFIAYQDEAHPRNDNVIVFIDHEPPKKLKPMLGPW